MKKKTLILTQEQLDEISGGNFNYLDNLATKPDMGDVYSTEVSADGATMDGYSDNMTTDKYAADMTRDAWPRDSRSYGKNGNYLPLHNLTEMSKKDWEKKNLTKEAKEHGNKRLNNRVFGDDKHQYGYSALKQKEYRERKAAKKVLTGQTATEKQQGLNSLAKMQDNSYLTAKKQFDPAKTADKLTQAAKPAGTKIESRPKTGKEGAHSPQTGYITPLNQE